MCDGRPSAARWGLLGAGNESMCRGGFLLCNNKGLSLELKERLMCVCECVRISCLRNEENEEKRLAHSRFDATKRQKRVHFNSQHGEVSITNYFNYKTSFVFFCFIKKYINTIRLNIKMAKYFSH